MYCLIYGKLVQEKFEIDDLSSVLLQSFRSWRNEQNNPEQYLNCLRDTLTYTARLWERNIEED